MFRNLYSVFSQSPSNSPSTPELMTTVDGLRNLDFPKDCFLTNVGKFAFILSGCFESLLPWLHRTTDLSSQLPASLCKLSWSSEARLPPNCPNRCLRNELWVTTAMHFSGRRLSHSRNATARAQHSSSGSLSSSK